MTTKTVYTKISDLTGGNETSRGNGTRWSADNWTFVETTDSDYDVQNTAAVNFKIKPNADTAFKNPCRVATTGNITLSGIQTIDGILLSVGDRVLVKDQTVPSQNGIYSVRNGTWVRTFDFNSNYEIVENTLIPVKTGNTNKDHVFKLDTLNPVVDSDISFSKALSTNFTRYNEQSRINFTTLSDFYNDSSLSYSKLADRHVSNDEYVYADGIPFKVADSSATDHDCTIGGGVKFYAVPISLSGFCYVPHQFGLIGDGNDPAIITAAAAKSANDKITLKIPDAQYFIDDEVILANNLDVLGTAIARSNTSRKPRMWIDSSLDSATPAFHSLGNLRMQNITFKGYSKTKGIGLYIRRDSSDGVTQEDTDTEILDCSFVSLNYGVKFFNRGFIFERNAAASCSNVINNDWIDSSFVDDSSQLYDGLPYGERAFRVRHNRVHQCTIFVNNNGTYAHYLRGVDISHNLMDLGNVLFNGDLYSGNITSNIIDLTVSNTGIIDIKNDPTGSINVSDNHICAGRDSDGPLVYGIRFRNGLSGSLVSRNTIRGATTYGIYNQGATTDTRFTDNILSNIGDSTSATASIYFGGNVDGCQLSNTFEGNVDSSACYDFGGNTISRSNITNNTYPIGKPLIYNNSKTVTTGNYNIFEPLYYTIADDDVQSIIPPFSGGFMNITLNANSAAPNKSYSGHFWFECGNTPSVDLNNGWNGTASANVRTTTLDVGGTTESDGTVTLSVRTTGLKIENRAGAAAEFKVSFL